MRNIQKVENSDTDKEMFSKQNKGLSSICACIVSSAHQLKILGKQKKNTKLVFLQDTGIKENYKGIPSHHPQLTLPPYSLMV